MGIETEDHSMEKQRECLILHERDNTVTALKDLSKGTNLSIHAEGDRWTLLDDIPYAHKFARCLIPAESEVLKYGEVIGRATVDIQPGAHVHVHNVVSIRARGET
jgi:altronate dehydratase small subunit